jgi:hypothetical protein
MTFPFNVTSGHLYKRLLLVCATSALCFHSDAAALQLQQRVTETNNARMRAECTAAKATLLRDRIPTAENARQVMELRQCRESAGEVLPAAWLLAQRDSVQLTTLLIATSKIRDGRIANVLESIVVDTTRDQLVRQAAAAALTTLLVDAVIGGIYREPSADGEWVVNVSLVSHLVQDDASVPIDAGLKARFIETLQGISGARPYRTSLQRLAALLTGYLQLR